MLDLDSYPLSHSLCVFSPISASAHVLVSNEMPTGAHDPGQQVPNALNSIRATEKELSQADSIKTKRH